MRFNHIMLDRGLEWDENKHMAELVVEDAVFLRKLMADFSGASLDEPAFAVSVGDEVLSLEKDVEVIFNPLKLDFGNRKSTGMLLKMLVKTSVSEEFFLSTNKLKTKIVKYLNELIDAENYVFEVEAGDFSMDAIAKAVSLHVVGDEDDFVELVTDYMAMMTELAGIRLFAFFNLRMLITDDELARLRENLCNHQLDVLLVEGKDFGEIVGVERIIVDDDLCEI